MTKESNDSLKKRILTLNDATTPKEGACVLYIVSRDVRVGDNHALLAAQKHAIELNLPLVVGFIAYAASGNRAREHFDFLYVGLKEFETELGNKNISFVARYGATPLQASKQLIEDANPSAVYYDFSPLRGPRRLKDQIAGWAKLPVFVVDTHNIVPVWVASDKQETAARTLRPKIHRQLGDYLEAPEEIITHPHDALSKLTGESLSSLQKRVAEKQKANGTKVDAVPGEKAARAALDDFVSERLKAYADKRNDPAEDYLSGLSSYLHYGMLSSLRVALEVEAAAKKDESWRAGADTLIEEMVIRKELSDNFCYYNDNYDRLKGAPEWALKTLGVHANDKREHEYTLEQFEQAKTDDPSWNAAQNQLLQTGKIHGYMRMYWAKKVLEWTKSPKEAMRILLYLNDFYHIDGGDPNGYVGILWSIAGLHDRPWFEREVYGQVRYMNRNGLKRKFDIEVYEHRWNG